MKKAKRLSKIPMLFSYDRHPVMVKKALQVLLNNGWKYLGTGLAKITFDGVDYVKPKKKVSRD